MMRQPRSSVDAVIPGNDDALRAIRLFASRIADAIIEGKQVGTEGNAAEVVETPAAEEIPVEVIEELKAVKGDKNDKKHKAFVEAVTNIERVVEKADFAFDKAIKLDENAIVSALFKLFK